MPVWLLLQPRDYVNSHQLIVALGLLVLGIAEFLLGLNWWLAPRFWMDLCGVGHGIAAEDQERLFREFVRIAPRNEKTSNVKGTGLGLSITYGLVQKLHGNITVQSKTGQGTTFVVTLPVHIQKEIQS